MDEQRIKTLIEVWWKKGTDETDKFSRFVFFWICFNAWLDYRSYGDRDRDMIEWLKGSKSDSSDLKQRYHMLQSAKKLQPYLQSLVPLPPVYDPRKPDKKIRIKDENDFPNIVEAIYQIRCNLFHGRKEAHEPRDQKLVQIAGEILLFWVGSLINNWNESK